MDKHSYCRMNSVLRFRIRAKLFIAHTLTHTHSTTITRTAPMVMWFLWHKENEWNFMLSSQWTSTHTLAIEAAISVIFCVNMKSDTSQPIYDELYHQFCVISTEHTIQIALVIGTCPNKTPTSFVVLWYFIIITMIWPRSFVASFF